MAKPLKSGEQLDRRDMKTCQDVYGPLIHRCAGGRVVVRGYICPHCESVDPDNECHRPSDNSRK